MSSPDFSGLASLRKDAPEAIDFGPALFAHVGNFDVRAFDQSLSNTGVVDVSFRDADITIMRATSITPETDLDGHEGNYAKFSRLIHSFRHHLTAGALGHRVAFERPPVGGKMARPESSILAGAAVRVVWPEAQMFDARKAKKMVCGNSNAKKTEAHRALKAACDGWVTNWHLVTNEAQRDAFLVALQAALHWKDV